MACCRSARIKDSGFYVQAAFFPIKQKLEMYGITSQIYGDETQASATARSTASA